MGLGDSGFFGLRLNCPFSGNCVWFCSGNFRMKLSTLTSRMRQRGGEFTDVVSFVFCLSFGFSGKIVLKLFRIAFFCG